MSLSDAKNVPQWQNNVFLSNIKFSHEYKTSSEVLLCGRVTYTLIKLRITFKDEKLFLIHDFDEVEYRVNTDFLNTPPFSLTHNLLWKSFFLYRFWIKTILYLVSGVNRTSCYRLGILFSVFLFANKIWALSIK